MTNVDRGRFQLKKSSSSTTLKRHGSASNVQRQRKGILLNPLRDSPPVSPGVGPTCTPMSSRRRRGSSFIHIITIGMQKWELLRRVFKLCVYLKHEKGKGRQSMTRGVHAKSIYHAATCSHCLRDYISDSNWFRCNTCLTEHVDLCRACFKAWAHHEHTFTEMSVAAFEGLKARKSKWRSTVSKARASGELEKAVDSFEEEAVKQLLLVFTEMVRGKMVQEDVEAVLTWAMSTRVSTKLSSICNEYGWTENCFEKNLDVTRAKLMKQDIQKVFRKTISLEPQEDTWPVAFTTTDKTDVRITAGEVLTLEVPSENRKVTVTCISITDDPTILVVQPEHIILKIPKHLLYNTLRSIRGLALKCNVETDIAEEMLEVIDSSDDELRMPKTRTGSMYIPGDPLGQSKQATEEFQEYNVRRGSDVMIKKLVSNLERNKIRKESDKETALKQSQTSAATRAAIKESSLRHLKKKRSQQSLVKSLWDSAATDEGLPKELQMLREMMSGLIEGVRSLVAVIHDKEDEKQNRKFTALDDVIKKVSCTELYICKEISSAINDVMDELRETRSMSKIDKGSQWSGAYGWEAVHASSRLRSGRVGFEKDDTVCYATTRHETVALGKEEIPSSAAQSVTLKYKIMKCGEGTYLGVSAPGMSLFDKDTSKRYGVFWNPDGTLYVAGSIVPIDTTSRYTTGDVLKWRIRNHENGFLKLYLNNKLVYSMPISCRHALVPYVMFNDCQNCRVEVFPLVFKDPRLAEDPLAATPAPVLRILRSLERDIMSAQDRSLKRPPPRGLVTLVFTDVQDSTALWEKSQEAMRMALVQHNMILRRLIEKYRGYEVKTEGDAFMVAFQRTESAMHWCIESQRELMKAKWPEDLLKHPEAGEERDNEGNIVLRGLRVRMGFHTGEPDCEQDPVTGRMDYFGPMVNLAARISGIGYGGEIVIGGAAFRHLHRCGALPDDNISLSCHGSKSLKGIAKNESLFSLLPVEFKTRPDCWVSSPRKSSALASPTSNFPRPDDQFTLGPSAMGTGTSITEQERDKEVKEKEREKEKEGEKPKEREKEPRWVRTVWRQAAARAVKKSEKRSDAQTQTGRPGGTPQSKANHRQHLQLCEKALMELHDTRKVYITQLSAESRLNGEEAQVLGWEGGEVLVSYKGGQILLPHHNLSTVSRGEILKQEQAQQTVGTRAHNMGTQYEGLAELSEERRRQPKPLPLFLEDERRPSLSSPLSISPHSDECAASPVLRPGGRVRVASTPSPLNKAPLQTTVSTFTFPGPLSAPLFSPARGSPMPQRRPPALDKRRLGGGLSRR